MLSFIKQNILVSALVGLALLGVGYYMFFMPSAATDPLTTSPDTTAASQEMLVVLGNLHAIHLDNTLFKDPAFTSLNDYGVTIALQPVGRHNPFAPIFAPAAAAPAVPETNIQLSKTKR